MNRYSHLKNFAIDYILNLSGITARDSILEYRAELDELSVGKIVSNIPVELQDDLFEEWTESDFLHLEYDWNYWGRKKQLPTPGNWSIWLLLAGRGFGKTRTGSEFIVERVKKEGKLRIGLVGETLPDVNDVMIMGESGILSCSPPWLRPVFIPSKKRLEFPNGSVAITYTGSKPDLLRGPNHHLVWLDEITKYKYPFETWDNMELGLRLGTKPQAIATTTPKNIRLLKELLREWEDGDDEIVVTYGSTFENETNLSKNFINRIVKKYKNTRLGMQELYAYILEDDPRALWNSNTFEDTRVYSYPELKKIVVGVDPPGGEYTECGIIVAGMAENQNVYILDDFSVEGDPAKWANQVLMAYDKWEANLIVAEKNQGGNMIESVLRTAYKKDGDNLFGPIGDSIPIKLVHASKGKHARAEPISTLYSKRWVHHVGSFGQLEDECCTYIPNENIASPNRLDAMVWAVTELMLENSEPAKAEYHEFNAIWG